MALQIAQRIESPCYMELQHASTQSQQSSQKTPMEPTVVTPMEIDVQRRTYQIVTAKEDRNVSIASCIVTVIRGIIHV